MNGLVLGKIKIMDDMFFDFGKELDTNLLEEYSSACTTRIVGLAAEECGRSSYDIDQTFDKEELMDPEFPLTMQDHYDVDIVTPEDIIVDICGQRVEVIVETIGGMEKCWTHMENCVKKENRGVAVKLWQFVKEEAQHHVQSMYGDECMEEFRRLGDALFKK